MAWWKNHPNTYKHSGFVDIPEGNHRVRICGVDVERLSKGRRCFEITLEVSGYHGKLWHHIWYDPQKIAECEKWFYPFFFSFGIEDHDLSHYKKWVGNYGAVNIRYEYRGCEFEAYIRCLYGKQIAKLPPWRCAPDNMELYCLKELPF